jgi:Osmosensitive K+ channel His kinase sensor domain
MIAMSGGMSADSTSSASRGRLRVYLAIAPGAGKTYAMLAEAKHLAERGVDVVVGFVETHGRAATEAMLGPLERIALAHISHRGSVFDELDAFWPSSTHDAPPAPLEAFLTELRLARGRALLQGIQPDRLVR